MVAIGSGKRAGGSEAPCTRAKGMKRASILWNGRKRGFTLVELLVVMAITTILLGLIFGPLVQGINLTNRARVQVLAQDTARLVMSSIQREIADGVFVFDNSGSSINIWVNNGGTVTPISIPFAMVDLVPPAHVNDLNTTLDPSNIDPTTGLAMDRGNVVLPVMPGRVIVRYWLGLRDNATVDGGGQSGMPKKPYHNYYADMKGFSLSDHNPVILYRAVVSPYRPDGTVDRRLFHVDAKGQPILYDPNFFYDNGVASEAYPGWKDANGDGQVNYSENWRAVARAMVPVDRADLVVAQRRNDGTLDCTRLIPQVRFQPTYVGSDSMAPSQLGDAGNEAPTTACTSVIGSYGHWATPYRLYVFKSSLDANPLQYYYWTGSGNVRYQESTFDTGAGQWSVTQDVDTGFNPLNPDLSAGQSPEIMFTVEPKRGVVNFAFSDSVCLHDSSGNPDPSEFQASDVNGEFNTAAADTNVGPLHAYRYVRLTNLPDGRVSPLTQIPGSMIVPGTEVVKGPDMRPGPHYGQEITYTRVPRRSDPKQLGPNEYMINYTDVTNVQDQNDPLQRAGTIVFDSRENGAGVLNSLPTQKADGSTADPIRVTYQLQNNRSSYVVKADYLTRQLMTFTLGVRLYDVQSGQPQQVTLTQRVAVRNLQR